MKVLQLTLGDIRFQFKYGFYFVYAVFTGFYIVVLKVLPEDWVEKLALLFIFSDPAALGLIFMGAIIHLEMWEHTIHSFYVAPITPMEYLTAKLVSLSVISLGVGLLIGISVQVITHTLWFIFGLFLGSLFFSALGFIVAFKSSSLNQFFLMIIPGLILIMIPGTSYLFGFHHPLLLLHPGIGMLEILSTGPYRGWASLILLGWFLLFFQLAHGIIRKAFKYGSQVIP